MRWAVALLFWALEASAIELVSTTEGSAPMTVTFDGTVFRAGGTAYKWDFGDGSVGVNAANTTHTYRYPGSYGYQLTVTELTAGKVTTRGQIRIADAEGNLPPRATLVASATSGANSLQVQLSCDCTAGSSEIVALYWRLGDGGSVQTGTTVTTTLRPGRYPVNLEVVDARGLIAHDQLEIVVTENGNIPPYCAAGAVASQINVGETATFNGTPLAGSDSLKRSMWILDDGTQVQGLTATRTYGEAGFFVSTFLVEDDEGLKCRKTVLISVLDANQGIPPRVISSPLTSAACGHLYTYSDGGTPVRAVGSAGWVWSVDSAPAGFSVSDAGVVDWTPTPDQRGTHNVMLTVTNAHGHDHQMFEVNVECTRELALQTPFGCGCGSGSGVSLLASLAALGAFLRRKVSSSSRRWL